MGTPTRRSGGEKGSAVMYANGSRVKERDETIWRDRARRTVLPATTLPAALVALQQRVPLLLAVPPAQGPSYRSLLCGRQRVVGVGGGGGDGDGGLSLGLLIEVDGERRAGTAGNRAHTQGLEGGDGPCLDVNGARRRALGGEEGGDRGLGLGRDVGVRFGSRVVGVSGRRDGAVDCHAGRESVAM